MDITIRNARAGDEEAIANIHVLAWQVAYKDFMSNEYLSSLSVHARTKEWKDTLSNPGKGKYLIAEADGIIKGFAVYGPARDEDLDETASELVALNIHPDSWRMKYGKSLLGAVIDNVASENYKTIHLWVINGNTPAINLYHSFGFQNAGLSKIENSHSGYPIHETRYSKTLG
jgi:L-amino acid N-acyltransferase YncA